MAILRQDFIKDIKRGINPPSPWKPRPPIVRPMPPSQPKPPSRPWQPKPPIRKPIPKISPIKYYKKGGKVNKTGLAFLHKGEKVLTVKQTKKK